MKDSDSISKKSSSDSENLVNKIVPEMPKDKRTKAYKEWVKKYGQEASDSNEIPDMPKDKRTKAYKEWIKKYGDQALESNVIPEMPKDRRTKAYKDWVKQYGDNKVPSKEEKVSLKSNKKQTKKTKTKKSNLSDKVDLFQEHINSEDWFNKRKEIEELRSNINTLITVSYTHLTLPTILLV